MKTQKSKELLERALRTLPQDFALRDVRRHMSRALTELSQIEGKREKRSLQLTPQERWKLDLESGTMVPQNLTPEQHKNILGAIDQMIQSEENKIKKINEPTDDDLLTD